MPPGAASGREFGDVLVANRLCLRGQRTRVAAGEATTGLSPGRVDNPANISTVTGRHTVYLEFSSGAGDDPPFV